MPFVGLHLCIQPPSNPFTISQFLILLLQGQGVWVFAFPTVWVPDQLTQFGLGEAQETDIFPAKPEDLALLGPGQTLSSPRSVPVYEVGEDAETAQFRAERKGHQSSCRSEPTRLVFEAMDTMVHGQEPIHQVWEMGEGTRQISEASGKVKTKSGHLGGHEVHSSSWVL